MMLADPYDPASSEFECASCGERLDSPAESCDNPLCDGAVRNIAVARE